MKVVAVREAAVRAKAVVVLGRGVMVVAATEADAMAMELVVWEEAVTVTADLVAVKEVGRTVLEAMVPAAVTTVMEVGMTEVVLRAVGAAVMAVVATAKEEVVKEGMAQAASAGVVVHVVDRDSQAYVVEWAVMDTVKAMVAEWMAEEDWEPDASVVGLEARVE